MSQLNSYQIYVDSRRRISGTSDLFNIKVNPPIQLKKSTNHFKVSILSATIPYSFRTVNSSNNILYIDYNGGIIPVTIPEGNYNINTLMSAVKTAIISAVSAIRTITMTFSYDRPSGRVTISYDTCSGIAINTIMIYSGSVVAKMLGINANLTINLASSATGQQNVDVNVYKSIYIRSDNLSQVRNQENILEQAVPSDVLAEIQLNVNYPAMIYWTNPTVIGVDIINRYIDQINLYLSSSDDYRMSLNGLDWNCLIQIDEHEPIVIESDPIISEIAPIMIDQQMNTRLSELQAEKERILKELEDEKEKIKKSL